MRFIFTLFLLFSPIFTFADTIYYNPTTIPLSYSRNTGAGLVSGLTVTVSVTNAVTNASLLASTSAPEVASGAGIYTYSWTPSFSSDTTCLVTYTVGASKYTEYIFITFDQTGGRAF